MKTSFVILPSSDGEGKCIATQCKHVLFERAILLGPLDEILGDLVSRKSMIVIIHSSLFSKAYTSGVSTSR